MKSVRGHSNAFLIWYKLGKIVVILWFYQVMAGDWIAFAEYLIRLLSDCRLDGFGAYQQPNDWKPSSRLLPFSVYLLTLSLLWQPKGFTSLELTHIPIQVAA